MSTPVHFGHLRDRFVTIVAFGDSITQVNHHTLGSLNWVGLLSMGLAGADAFPQGYTIINSGNGGDNMGHALARLDRDVLRFNPDIVIVSYGMNDCRVSTPEEFRNRLVETIRRIRAGRKGDGAAGGSEPPVVVLRTPNPMLDFLTGRELNEVMNGDKKVCTDLSSFARVIREVAVEESTLCVDHYTLWMDSQRSTCYRDMVQLMNDPFHPNALGHRRFYHELAPLFNAHRNFFYEWERILRDQGVMP